MQDRILHRSFRVAVEILRFCLRESNVPRLNEYFVMSVYVEIPLRRKVSQSGSYVIIATTSLRSYYNFSHPFLNIPDISGIIENDNKRGDFTT